MAAGARHPILGLRRSETQALCAAAGLAPSCDQSNDDPAFVRNRVRHELLPLCAQVAGRDPVPVLARQAGVLRDEVALLDTLATELVPDPADARAVAAAPLPLARRALRRWLRRAGGRRAPAVVGRGRSHAGRRRGARRWGRSCPGGGGCAGPAAASGSNRPTLR